MVTYDSTEKNSDLTLNKNLIVSHESYFNYKLRI